ncbi:MAG: hypothetical protein IT306_03145 [Chloroflexi bacterium]|nr:hypothetical protein [Chloroflexota bacterium]
MPAPSNNPNDAYPHDGTFTPEPTTPVVVAAPVTASSPDDLAMRLGQFILDQLPYSAEVAFPALEVPSPDPFPNPLPSPAPVPAVAPKGYHAKAPVEIDGAYAESNADRPFLTTTFVSGGSVADWDLGDNGRGKLKYWETNDAYHQVTKSMRIWYTYTSPNLKNPDGTPKVVGSWLLIGYVGNGH